MFKRTIPINSNPKESFFLWGPRQSGKSTFLKKLFPNAKWIDLLKTDDYICYLEKPYLLREELISEPEIKLVIIDEIQKVPLLLNEVHWLIENKNIIFGLCGSSARKVRKGHANLLGGRALSYEMFGLTSNEIGETFELNHMLNAGYLPKHYLSSNPNLKIRSYVNNYLKEEIAAEGLVRNLPHFANFLHAASLSDSEIINYTNIARDCSISVPGVKEYFQILVDTLLGHFVPAYTKRPKRRLINAPKFYFFDIGVVNFLAKRGEIKIGSELFGKALENFIFHELISYCNYKEKFYDISYWRTSSGIEVDFIINDFEYAIEVKSSANIHNDHLKGLREAGKDYNIKKRILVCLEKKLRTTNDGIEIMPVENFCKKLWNNSLFKI